MRYKGHFALLLALMAGLSMSACDNGTDCSESGRKMANVRFMRPGDRQDTIVLLTVTALGTDSVIDYMDLLVTSVSLPLRMGSELTEFVLHFDDILRDTLRVRHLNVPYHLGPECGYQIRQDITEVSLTRHVMDSIAIKKNKLSSDNADNIWIYSAY